ncbi:hypothetical protein KIPB_012928, partial [Kipferlia bialata]
VSTVPDLFMQGSNQNQTGMLGAMARLHLMLQRVDRPVAVKLKRLGISPEFYAVGWVVSMFSQALPLPDVCRVWDGVVASLYRYEVRQQKGQSRALTGGRGVEMDKESPLDYVLCLACAVVLTCREAILSPKADMSVMAQLQQPACLGQCPSVPIDTLVAQAVHMQETFLQQGLASRQQKAKGGRKR